VYKALGVVLTDYNRFDEAIAIYKNLQADPRWKFRPENPEFQMQVVKLYASGATPNLEASGKARVEITEKYGDEGEWALENRTNPEALATARTYIRESLEDVAIEYRKTAEGSDAPADYALAAEKFGEYLDKFPMSDDYYQIQFYLADSLYRAEKFPEAAHEYESLIKSRKHHPYGDGAFYQLMRARQLIAEAKYGADDPLPPDATVEKTYTSVGQKEIKVFALEPEYKSYIDAADAVLAHDFVHPSDPTQADWKQQVDDNRSKLMYIPAKILMAHNRFDEARPRLLDIINNQKCSDEAAYAATYIVDSYSAEGDLANIRLYTKKFMKDPPGCGSGLSAEEAGKFADLEQQAAFLQAIAFADAGDVEGAAQAFLDFRKEFPQSDRNNDALYNAATYNDRLGHVEKANDLYEQYVEEYPKDDRSAKLYYIIAANYESTFDFDKAVDYYNRLIKTFPNDPNTADAVFNRAFLKIGIGDHQGAATGFQQYAAAYPTHEDAADVEWMAGEQWEQVSATKAIEFYDGYRKKYGTANPDHALECDVKAGNLYKSQGNNTKYNQYLDKTDADFSAIIAEGKDIGLDGRHAAAEAGFRPIKQEYDALGTPAPLDLFRDKHALDKLKDREAKVQKLRTDAADFAARYGDFDYTMAGSYLRAQSLLDYAEWGLALKCPDNLGDDDFAACSELLDEKVYPQFDAAKTEAVKELNDMIALSKDKKLYSDWVDKAFEALNDVDPLTYPAQKKELPGPANSQQHPQIVPLHSSDRKPAATPEKP